MNALSAGERLKLMMGSARLLRSNGLTHGSSLNELQPLAAMTAAAMRIFVIVRIDVTSQKNSVSPEEIRKLCVSFDSPRISCSNM